MSVAVARNEPVLSSPPVRAHVALRDCTRHNQARQGREMPGSVALRRVRSPLPGNTWEFWWASEYLDPPYRLSESDRANAACRAQHVSHRSMRAFYQPTRNPFPVPP